MVDRIRKGKGYRWSDATKTGFGTREVSGFVVDNLDTKSLSDAESQYERLFIIVRTALEGKESYCMDVEEERLDCCQVIADMVSASGILSRES